MDNFRLPTLLIHQLEPTEWEGETAEDEVSDEVFFPCCICQLFTLHYLLFDVNAKSMLILSNGYWSVVIFDKFCEQSAIIISKGVPKGIIRSANLVN